MQDKFLLFLMLQKIIQTKYDLDVIGLIQISPRVYKVKTANHFYCVKIVDENKQTRQGNHVVSGYFYK